MALKVPVILRETYEDLAAGFTGPTGYLYSSATEDGSYSLVTTQAIPDDVQGLEYWDASGTSDGWYKHRVGNLAATSFDVDLDDAVAFQPGGLADDYTDLSRWKLENDHKDQESDSLLWTAIRSITSLINLRVGVFLGPSSSTTFTFDGSAAVRDGRRIWIPGGMRSFTTAQLKTATGGSWETIATGDVRLGPRTGMRPGQPYLYAEFLDVVTGSHGRWYAGMDNGRFTGCEIGYAEREPQLVAMSDMILSRMVADHDRGSLASPTPTKFLYDDDDEILRGLSREHFSGVI